MVGTQDIGIQETVIASGVLDGLPFDLQWAVLPGPAAQLSGLYAKSLDVGLMGDTSLIIEQGRSKFDWTLENAPLQIVAGWRNNDRNYPPDRHGGSQQCQDRKPARTCAARNGPSILAASTTCSIS